MNTNDLWGRFKAGARRFWEWIRPHLAKFHEARKRVWKKYHINKIILLLVLVFTLAMSIYLFYLAKTANVSTLQKDMQDMTTIYDRKNEKAGTLFGQKGTYVNGDHIAQNLKDAVVSTEDKRFYQHHGFDLRGIARAGISYIIHFGRISGGGSTITQQLAKNAYLTQEQTFTRKAKELFLAIELEKKYSKDEILTMYLNKSYFGNGVWGAEDASQKYFGKSASELTVGESAILAGILKGPNIYNPIDHPENAVKRRATVLQLMVDNQKISQATADEQAAISIPALLEDTYQGSDTGYQYPYFFDEVIREAKKKYGIDEDDLLTKGYKVYTTLDQGIQQGLQDSFADDSLFPPNAADGTPVQAGSVALDPKTGGVYGVVGGRGTTGFLNFDRATMAAVPPGSTMKPIVAYTPALEDGMKPTDMVEDQKQSYYPEGNNLSGEYSGEMPMYQALANSINMPAVWLLHKVGLERGVAEAEKFGIKLKKSDQYYGLALGGLTTGVSPLTMASAYGVFASGGKKAESHFITKIVDATGAVVGDYGDPKSERVISQEVANEMTSMLLGVFSNGTAVNAQPTNGYVMAGKTGSTETSFQSENVKDKWLVGYTKDVVLSTWMGFDETSETHSIDNNWSGQSGIAAFYRTEAEAILPHTSSTPFEVKDASAKEEESSSSSSDWRQKIKDIGGKIKDDSSGWGDSLKENTDKLGEKIKDGVGKARQYLDGLLDGN